MPYGKPRIYYRPERVLRGKIMRKKYMARKIQRAFRGRKKYQNLNRRLRNLEDRGWLDKSVQYTATTNGSVNSAFGINQCPPSAQADADEVQTACRTGDAITIKSIQLKSMVFNASDDVYNHVRYLLVYIPDVGGDGPSIGDILERTPTTDPTAKNNTKSPPSHLSFLKKGGAVNYKVFCDKTFKTENNKVSVGSVSAVDYNRTYPHHIQWSKTIKFKQGLKIKYSKSSGQPKSNFYHVVISDSISATNGHPFIILQSRVNYIM
jgi:hypothetical protein